MYGWLALIVWLAVVALMNSCVVAARTFHLVHVWSVQHRR